MDLSSPADIRPPQAEEMTAKQIHADLATRRSLHSARLLAMLPEHMFFAKAISVLDPYREQGMTMDCVTPKMGLARDILDRAAYFHQGVMAESGKPEQIFGSSQHPEMHKLLASVH